MQFMCETHRRRICRDPRIAALFCGQWMQMAEEEPRAEPRRRLSLLGCSFEVSLFLVGEEQSDLCTDEKMDYLLRSGHALADCYAEAEKTDVQLHVLLTVHSQLLLLLKNEGEASLPLRRALQESERKIGDFVGDSGEFDGYRECLLETRSLAGASVH